MEKNLEFLFENELAILTKENDISLYEVGIEIDNTFDKAIQLWTLNQFFQLFYELGKKILYCNYTYYEAELFLIPEDYEQQYFEKIQEAINKKAKEYNDFVERYDFEQPAFLFLYFLHDGFLHYLHLHNETFSPLLPYEDKHKEIVSIIRDDLTDEELYEYRIEAQKLRDKKAEEVQQIVLKDKNFHSATNNNLRLTYANRLFETHPEYKEKLQNAGYTNTTSFFESTWKLYKQRM